MQVSRERGVGEGLLFFWGIPHGFPVILNILRNYAERWTMSAFVGICHTSYLLKFGYQTLNCPSIRHIAPAKIFPALPLCQKNWFCSKVRVDDFYSLLLSIASSWIHIGVKRVSQACYLHLLKYMKKKCKTQLWDEKQNRALFWVNLYVMANLNSDKWYKHNWQFC